MTEQRISELKNIAMDIRITGLKMEQNAHSGHIGGAFSLSEIMAVLYFEKMMVRPKDPQWEDRDRFVLSKGHATVALYPTLALRGFFDTELLKTFRNINGHMSGHAEMRVPGVDMSTGSLGQGFSAAVGMALAAKLRGKSYTTYAILGDGEIEEGQIWEACMFSAAHKLDNLVAVLDSNKLQLDGSIKDILDTGDLQAKFTGFGFHVNSIDGHDVAAIAQAIDEAKAYRGKPSVIIANTVKGKGISFMENNFKWHGKVPNDEEYCKCFDELNCCKVKLEG